MNYKTIILEKKEGIATITLNRPDRLNTLSAEMSRELWYAIEEIERDPESRVLVLAGAVVGLFLYLKQNFGELWGKLPHWLSPTGLQQHGLFHWGVLGLCIL